MRTIRKIQEETRVLQADAKTRLNPDFFLWFPCKLPHNKEKDGEALRCIEAMRINQPG